MPAKTGREYVERIDEAAANVWIDGQQVKNKFSKHPAFKNMMETQAHLYDMQYDDDHQQTLTYESPLSGDPVGVSYKIPRTKEDLLQRGETFKRWADETGGMLGRSPDYMNTAIMTFGSAAELFGDKADHVKQYYQFCRENDITLTHTFIKPQVDRSSTYSEETNEQPITAQIVDQDENGIVVHGARLLATQGATSDEILVFPSGTMVQPLTGNPHAMAFAIPTATPGLRFICRESYEGDRSSFDRPLSAKFDEIDTLVVFDQVKVPWERVFIAGEAYLANRVFSDTSFTEHAAHQAAYRQIAKTEFLLGLLQMVIDTINVSEFGHIQEKTAEVIVALEAMKGLLLAEETNARPNEWGVVTPDKRPLLALMNYYPRIYPRISEILQTIGASGLIMLPTEADFQSDRRNDLEQYMQAANATAVDRVKTFRLAWDACMSSFGTRQTQYEKYFFGDPVRLAGRLYNEYDRKTLTDHVLKFLNTH
ncbi:MAG TPA: 4-hydroxyphenylacetate 3-monooxygenase, oxygenase component [Bacillales bacterium]|nr:4-hydroxyphenylacetate 3-monooxygenase, oxygenase component [Bacillales bacterium]